MRPQIRGGRLAASVADSAPWWKFLRRIDATIVRGLSAAYKNIRFPDGKSALGHQPANRHPRSRSSAKRSALPRASLRTDLPIEASASPVNSVWTWTAWTLRTKQKAKATGGAQSRKRSENS